MTKEQKLIQKIQEANPEILELKFGCEVKIDCVGQELNEIIDMSHLMPNGKNGVKYDDSDCYNIKEILGRQITLADVLLAIDDLDIGINAKGIFISYQDDGTINHRDFLQTDYSWDLKEDLLNQSQETKDFLIKIFNI